MQLQKSAIVLLREEKSSMISEKRLEDLKTKAIIKEKNELLAKNKKMAAEIQKLKGERETAGAQAEKLETSLRQELKNRKYEIDEHVQQQRKQQALIQETKEKTVKQLDDNELRIAGEKIGLDDELEVIVVEEDKMKGELAKEQESEVKKLKETNKRQKEELTSKEQEIEELKHEITQYQIRLENVLAHSATMEKEKEHLIDRLQTLKMTTPK